MGPISTHLNAQSRVERSSSWQDRKTELELLTYWQNFQIAFVADQQALNQLFFPVKELLFWGKTREQIRLPW